MKAVVTDKYGPPSVQKLAEVERPQPKDDEVLVRIHATTVNRSDCGMRSGKPLIARFFYGLTKPKRRILGYELAGEIVDVGANVTEFAVGDRVFGVGPGAHAEYIVRPQTGPIAQIPEGLTYEEAAAIPDGVKLAGTSISQAGLGPGTRILVYGASGSIGTAGVQLAKHHYGAHVTAVCQAKDFDLVRSLGADELIDYTQEDFAARNETYEVVLDAVGKDSFAHSKRVLKPDGLYLPTDGFRNFFLHFWSKRFGNRKVRFTIPKRWTKEDILFTKGLVESGKYRPVVDRTYPLEEVVAATEYVESGQKVGNVVITVAA